MTTAGLVLLFVLSSHGPQEEKAPLRAQAIEASYGIGTFFELPGSLSVLSPVSETIRTSGGGSATVAYLIGEVATEEVPSAQTKSYLEDLSGLGAFIFLVLFGGTVSLFTEDFKTSSRGQEAKRFGWTLVFGIGLAVSAYSYLVEHNKTATLWVDNATAESARVFADSVLLVEVPALSHTEVEVVVEHQWVISRGLKEVALRVEAGQAEPVRATLLMEKWGDYLYNVGGANSYEVTRRSYR